MSAKPTYEQAQLNLQLYEMRREPRLREARDWYFKNYFAENLDEAMRLAPPGSQEGTFLMMVFGYWDQACAMLNYGLLHEDLFFETNNEFYGVWDRAKACLAEARERFSNKVMLSHMEQAANRYEAWIEKRSPGHLNAMREMTKQMRAQAAKTKAA